MPQLQQVKAGTSLFKAALGWIPAAGNAMNAAIAVGVTETLGTAFTGFCELAYKHGEKPNLSKFKKDDFDAYLHFLEKVKNN